MSQPLRIGAGFLGHLSSEVTVRQVVEAAQLCEQAGLDSFWVADQRWLRDPWVTLSAIAESTDRILLGTRITDPYIRHPAVTAVAAATLYESSDGRFVLGLGAGGSGLSQIGLERRRPLTRLREAITLIRQLWTGDYSPFNGEIITWTGGTLGFECNPDIPVVIASRGPKLLALAGEIADAAIIAAGTSPAAITWARTHINLGASRGNRSSRDIELLHQTYLCIDDQDPDTAVQAAKQGVLGAVIGSFPSFDFLQAAGLQIPADLYQYLHSGRRDRGHILSMIPDSFVNALTAAGSSLTVTERIKTLSESGIQHILLAAIPTPRASAHQQLERFIRNVLPEVR